MALFGACRIHIIEARVAAAPKLDVAIVQASAPYSGCPLRQAIAVHRDASMHLAQTRAVDLVIWPEEALNGVERDAVDDTLRHVTRTPSNDVLLSAPILTGALLRHEGALTNSALLYADGAVHGTYAKPAPLAFV